jgi:hypothetical protein
VNYALFKGLCLSNDNLNNGLLLDIRGGRILRSGSVVTSTTSSGDDANWHSVSRSAVGTFDNGVFRIPSGSAEVGSPDKDEKESGQLDRSKGEGVSIYTDAWQAKTYC